MEFWPAFDIFHRLRPYLCSKRDVLGFHRQATHRRPGDEPYFYFGVHCSWLGMAQKWTILDQKRSIWTKHGRLVNVPKGSTMVEPSVLDHLGWSGPFCTILDKNKFFAPNGQSKVWRRCLLEVGDNLSDSIQCFYLKIIQTNIRFKMAHPKFNSIYYTIRNKSANFFLIN